MSRQSFLELLEELKASAPGERPADALNHLANEDLRHRLAAAARDLLVDVPAILRGEEPPQVVTISPGAQFSSAAKNLIRQAENHSILVAIRVLNAKPSALSGGVKRRETAAVRFRSYEDTLMHRTF